MMRAARDLALDVIVRVMFGVEDRTERTRLGRPFEELLDLGSSEQLILRVAMHSVGGLRRWPKLDRANQGIDDLLTPMIAARRQDADLHERTDIMSLLLTARSEDGEYLTDKEIRDDLVTLVLAGHETTATTLAWMVDLLLHHPRVLAKVQAEADAGESTAYTQAVINETLRIRPPSPFTGRYTAGDYRLGGYTVPARTRIVPHIGEVNLNAADIRPPARIPARAVPGLQPADLCVDPVRRRHQALPRRKLQPSRAHRRPPNTAALRQLSRPSTTIRTSRSVAESCCCRIGGFRSATTPSGS